MAGIKSLAVRGIRSFGPDKNDEQRITFQTPLTLILGQNGCGKTTIIECLRYAITGQMPPGSSDECFVHDAKVNKSTEVLGEVKLEILAANDEQLEVTRAMRVTALPDRKVKFQTLSSQLRLTNEHGESRDVTLDMDLRMHNALGVSDAILNSVIFCHQEDSTWPLDDGQKVKERFDEIFDSEKYSECFEHLKKLRKEYSHDIKLLEQEVDHLFEKKEELEKKKLDVESIETLITEANAKIEELSKELEEVSAKLETIKTMEKSIVGLENKRDKIKVKLENFQTQEKELKNAIKSLFEGTVEELNQSIATHDQTVRDKQKELIEIYERKSAFDKEREKIENEMTYNKVKLNEFNFLENQNKEKVDRRNKLIEEALVLAELESKEIKSEEEADKAIKDLQQKVKELNKDLTTTQSQADDEANKLQSYVNACRDALSRHNEKISNKELDIETAKKHILKKDNEINDANVSRSRLDEIEAKLKAAEQEHQAAIDELNTEDLQKEMNEDEKLIEQNEKELDELNQKVTKLQKQSAKIAERDTIDRSIKDKQEQLSSLLSKHSATITELLGTLPEENFAVAVNKVEAEWKAEVKSSKQKLKEKQKELTSLEAERKTVGEMLSEKRAEIVKSDAKIKKACGNQTYDETLKELTSLVEDLQEKQAVLQASTVVIDKYKSLLKDTNCCPLCNRGFNSDLEVTDLISSLGKQVLNVPAELEKVTEELQRTSAKKDDLLALKSVNGKISSLRDKERDIETRLEGLDGRIKALQTTVEELTAVLKEPEQKLQNLKQISGDMPLLDRYKTEIAISTKKLDDIRSQCDNGIDTDMTLDEATSRQRDLRHETSTLRTTVRTSQKKLNSHVRKLQTKSDAKNKLKEKMLNIQKKGNTQDNGLDTDMTLEEATSRQRDLRHETSTLRTSQKKLNAHVRKLQTKSLIPRTN
ncbi:DNA repair protein RAD50-like [Cydia splendana]|uniref:DNA repair protein RAD50-like n=1 Tax=Cydia splendana TaxID=1100963 RepID=UPI00300C9755